MTGYFTGGEPVELIGHRGRIMADLTWESSVDSFRVPKGFEYDGASIPDFAWSIVGHPFMRGYRRPAALHDFLCREKRLTCEYVHRLFFTALRAEGVVWWRAKLMYYSVKFGGPKW